MNSHLSSVALVGVASSFADSEFSLLFDNQPEHIAVPRKLKRYMAPAAINSLTATSEALAHISLAERATEVGIYTSQTGYGSPFYSEFSAALPESADSAAQTFKALWSSERVNPFLITNALNNNLLGISGLNWQLNGDACAFIRDQLGAFGALQEAIVAIDAGECQLAIVAIAGNSNDPLAKWLQDSESEMAEKVTNGATTLILASEEWLSKTGHKAVARLSILASGYHLNTEQLNTLIAEYLKPSHFLSYYIESAKGKNRLLADALASCNVANHHLNSYSGSDICPGVVTSVACNLSTLRKQNHSTGVCVNCDQAGFYSFVRIENESL